MCIEKRREREKREVEIGEEKDLGTRGGGGEHR